LEGTQPTQFCTIHEPIAIPEPENLIEQNPIYQPQRPEDSPFSNIVDGANFN